MKKILAVFMAVLMLFSCISIVSFAAATEDTTAGENTTRDIQNEDGLVVPINFTQLKTSIIFKVFEKIFKFILNLFAGDDADAVDQSIASEIASAGDEVASAIEEGSKFIDNNQ